MKSRQRTLSLPPKYPLLYFPFPLCADMQQPWKTCNQFLRSKKKKEPAIITDELYHHWTCQNHTNFTSPKQPRKKKKKKGGNPTQPANQPTTPLPFFQRALTHIPTMLPYYYCTVVHYPTRPQQRDWSRGALQVSWSTERFWPLG